MEGVGGRVHELMIPPAAEALVASPTWARSSGHAVGSWQPVSLVMALEDEPSGHHAGMVSDHRDVLEDLTGLANMLLAQTASDAVERRDVGYNVVLFGAELASALAGLAGPGRIDEGLRRACAEAVTAATLAAAACLADTISGHQLARVRGSR